MRIYFPTMAYPKRLAKRFSKLLPIPLNQAQACCAAMYGYKDWHELEVVTAAQRVVPTKPDGLLAEPIVITRRAAMQAQLFPTLNRFHPCTWEGVEQFIANLDPTGGMPTDPRFDDPTLDYLFPRQWQLDREESNAIFEEPGFSAHVGMEPSCTVAEQMMFAASGTVIDHRLGVPMAEYGDRVFTFDFANREPFTDLPPDTDFVAALTFRLIPTISEQVLTALELSIHTPAFCSEMLSDEQAVLIASSIQHYLLDSKIWCDNNGPVTGSAEGISITLSGWVQSASIVRILCALHDGLEHCQGDFIPYDNLAHGDQLLPVRELFVTFRAGQ